MNGSTPWINHQVNNLPFNPFKALKNPWKYKAGKPTKSLISTYLHFAKLTTSEPVHEVHPHTGSKTAAKTQGFVVEHCLCHCYMKLKEHAEITWLNAPFLFKHLKKCFFNIGAASCTVLVQQICSTCKKRPGSPEVLGVWHQPNCQHWTGCVLLLLLDTNITADF